MHKVAITRHRIKVLPAAVLDGGCVYMDAELRRLCGVSDGDYVSISTDTSSICRRVARVPRHAVGTGSCYVSEDDYDRYLGLVYEVNAEVEIGWSEVDFAFPEPIP